MENKYRPQKGPQTTFLNSPADIAIYGGSAGSGKSYALLLEAMRHCVQGPWYTPGFAAIIFRRETVQIRNPGALLDESKNLYPDLGATLKDQSLEWNFPGDKTKVKFAHLEHETTKMTYQGSQLPLLCFDELTHFSESQFFYLLTRNRSTCGVKPYVRCTTNPDADSWVRTLIDWWIDPISGLPLHARSGVARWFIRQNEALVWGDTREELISQYGEEVQPKSLTFISALLSDNKILMDNDPDYKANLLAVSRVERERLLHGNWNTKASSGSFFQRDWFKLTGAITNAQVVQEIRYWDRAATKPSEANPDPDWTVGIKLAKLNTGAFIIRNIVRVRETPLQVEALMKQMARIDGPGCIIGLEQDPGSAGLSDISNMTRLLAGYQIRVTKPTRDKETRAKAVSAQAEHGNILMIDGPWNEMFLREAIGFPETDHDDQIDALSGAFNELALSSDSGPSILDFVGSGDVQQELFQRWGLRFPE